MTNTTKYCLSVDAPQDSAMIIDVLAEDNITKEQWDNLPADLKEDRLNELVSIYIGNLCDIGISLADKDDLDRYQ